MRMRQTRMPRSRKGIPSRTLCQAETTSCSEHAAIAVEPVRGNLPMLRERVSAYLSGTCNQSCP